MTTVNPEPPVQIASIFSDVTAHYVDIAGNANVIEESTIDRVLAAHDEGCLADAFPDDDELRRREVRRMLRSIANGNQKRLKKVATRDQSILDLGNDYDQVLTVCSAKTLLAAGGREDDDASIKFGRRTTLGNLTANDWMLIDLEQDIKFKELATARMVMRGVVARDLPTWQRYANYRQMREQSNEAAS